MAAYFVIDLTVIDPKKLAEYEQGANVLVKKYGGKFLTRGGSFDVIEGDWRPERLVIEEYPTLQAIHEMFNDPDNEPLKMLRRQASKANAVAVTGSTQ